MGKQKVVTSKVKTKRQHSSSPSSSRSSPFDDATQYAAFQSQLSTLSLRLQNTTGDGNCLFRALGDQVTGQQSQHPHYREMAVEEMRRHPTLYAPFIDGPLPSYLSTMQRMGEWGGHLELVAVSRALQRTVVVHQLEAPRLVIRGEGNDGGGEDERVGAIHLAYHSEEHYSSVRRMDDDGSHQPPLPISLPLTSPAVLTVGAVSPVERMVMERSGCGDVLKVRQCLRDMEGDSETAIDVLKAEAELLPSPPPLAEPPPAVKSTETGEAEVRAEEEAREAAREAKEEAKRAKAALSAKEKRVALKAEREAKRIARAKERKVERVKAKAEEGLEGRGGAGGEGQKGEDGKLVKDFGSLSI